MIETIQDLAGHPVQAFYPEGLTDPVDAVVVWLREESAPSLAESPDLLGLLQRHRLAALAPCESIPFWFDRVVPSFDPTTPPISWLRNTVLPFIAEKWNLRPPRIGIAGVGWGGQGALRAAYLHPDQFPVVAVYNAAVDFNEIYGSGSELDELFSSAETARQQTVTLRMHPLNLPRKQWHGLDQQSPWFEGGERLLSKIHSIGIACPPNFPPAANSLDPLCHFLADSLRETISYVGLPIRKE